MPVFVYKGVRNASPSLYPLSPILASKAPLRALNGLIWNPANHPIQYFGWGTGLNSIEPKGKMAVF